MFPLVTHESIFFPSRSQKVPESKEKMHVNTWNKGFDTSKGRGNPRQNLSFALRIASLYSKLQFVRQLFFLHGEREKKSKLEGRKILNSDVVHLKPL